MYNVSTPAHGTSVYHENLTRIGKKNLQLTYPNGRTLGCDSETHVARPLKGLTQKAQSNISTRTSEGGMDEMRSKLSLSDGWRPESICVDENGARTYRHGADGHGNQ